MLFSVLFSMILFIGHDPWVQVKMIQTTHISTDLPIVSRDIFSHIQIEGMDKELDVLIELKYNQNIRPKT